MSTVLDCMVTGGFGLKATRTCSQIATSVRLVQYPSGAQSLQGAYPWTEGFKGGIEWKDLPIIMVDSKGQEFTHD